MIFGQSSPVGLDIGSDSIKAVKLLKRGKKIFLKGYDMAATPKEAFKDGKIIDSAILGERIKTLFRGKWPIHRRVNISLRGHSVLLRQVSMPPMSDRELKEAIVWEAEKHIMMPAEEAVIDFFKIEDSGEKGEINLILIAVDKEIVEGYISALERSKLHLAAVEIEILSLIRAAYPLVFGFKKDLNREAAAMVLDLGGDLTNLVIFDINGYKFSRSIPIGGFHLTEAVAEELGISEEEAEIRKRNLKVKPDGPVTDLFNWLIKEIKRSMEFYFNKPGFMKKSVQKILVTGGLSQVEVLNQYLQEELDIKVDLLNPLNYLAHSKSIRGLHRSMPLLTTSVGLALRGWVKQ